MGPEHHNQQRAVLLHYKRWTKGKQIDLICCCAGFYVCCFFFFLSNRKVIGEFLALPLAVCLREWLFSVCVCRSLHIFVCDCSLALLSASHYDGRV